MAANLPRIVGNTQEVTGPARVIRSAKRIWLPSGAMRELVSWTLTHMGPDGSFVTDELLEVRPGLDCPDFPRDIRDIRECYICKSVVCRAHSRTCAACGKVACSACLARVTVNETSYIVCKKCRTDIKSPKWVLFLKKLFAKG
jgi:hypothetical protein